MSPDQIADFLDQWSAGYIFLIIVGVYTVAKKLYEIIKKITNQTEEQVTKKIKDSEKIDGILTDITSLKTEIDKISNDVDNYKGIIDGKLKEIIKNSSENGDEFIKSLDEIKNTLMIIDPKVKILEDKISKLESQINVLITSDVEYIRAYITDSYKKFVKELHHIDLMSLQNVESIYNRFLQETGSEDEFLSKLMRELRNLPTTKDDSHE
mgnify:CR=1 FL=1